MASFEKSCTYLNNEENENDEVTPQELRLSKQKLTSAFNKFFNPKDFIETLNEFEQANKEIQKSNKSIDASTMANEKGA